MGDQQEPRLKTRKVETGEGHTSACTTQNAALTVPMVGTKPIILLHRTTIRKDDLKQYLGSYCRSALELGSDLRGGLRIRTYSGSP
jgi:hypothetical protein